MKATRKQYQSLFDRSACLRKRQMFALIEGKLFPEEMKAVEIHLASCNLCRQAFMGLKLFKTPLEQALLQVNEPSFPDVEINEQIVYSAPSPILKAQIRKPVRRKPKKSIQWSSSLTMIVLLIVGGYIIYEFEYKKDQSIQFPTQRKIPLKISEPFIQKSAVDQENLISSSMVQTLPKEEEKASIMEDHSEVVQAAPLASSSIHESNVQQAEPKVVSSPTPPLEVTMNKESNHKTPAPTVEKEKETPIAPIVVEEEKVAVSKENGPKSLDFNHALAAYEQKNYGTALLYLQNILKDSSHPQYLDALYYAALSQKGLGKSTAAQQLVNELKKHPSHSAYDLDAFND